MKSLAACLLSFIYSVALLVFIQIRGLLPKSLNVGSEVASKKFFKIDVLKNFVIFTEKHLDGVSFNKACNIIKKRPRHRCVM